MATDLPDIAQAVDGAVRKPMVRIREELRRLLGLTGDPLDAAITLRSAIARGLVDSIGNSLSGSVTYVNTFPGYSVPDPGAAPDLTPPPTVTGLTAVGGFTQVIVEWAAATYTEGHGHQKTNIYAVKKVVGSPDLPTFTDAVRVYEATGALTIASLPSELNTRWHIWAKYETHDGVESTSPAGGANGVICETGQDITQLLEVLTGSITASQLYTDLGTRIDLVEALQRALAATSQTLLQTLVSIHAVGRDAQSGLALVQEEITLKVNTDVSAEASKRELLAVTVADNTASIETEATARVSADGSLFAQYTVKVDVNGYVSGYGLASTSTGLDGAVPFSSFIIRADSFAIASPTGPGITPATPFIVRTTISTENGVSIPVGVYMDSAYIVNVSALYARFGTLIADSIAVGQIDAANLTLGSGAIGGNLKSTSYTAGSGSTPGTGWLIQPGGNVFFNNATVYGTIYATNGVFGGALSAATGTFAGSLSAATGTFAGALSAATGTFAGALSAATGTFSGALSAVTGSLGALSVGGALTLSSTGYIIGGQSAYGVGVGIFAGYSGGTYKLYLGDPSGANFAWDGTQLLINNAILDSLSASIPGGSINLGAGFPIAAGVVPYGTRAVSVSGGRSPYTYTWIVSNGANTQNVLSDVWVSSGTTASATVSVAGSGDGWTNFSRLICFVQDANGRLTMASVSVQARHASGFIGGGGGDAP